MKQLTCEMCGSNNMVKQDGMFVCQNCGIKYSVEEARKMMVEGPVHVDSSHLTSNYFSMAKNALDAGNNAEADNYCNKILEVDPTAYEAWFVKGKAVGRQSTLGNQRISETINAFSNALDNCPEGEKEELAESCKQEIENLHKALLTGRMQIFMSHPNDNDLAQLTDDVKKIMVNTINFLTKAGVSVNVFGKELGSIIINTINNNYNAKIWNEYQGNDGKPNDYEFKRFMSETDICVNALNLATVLLGSDDTDDLELYEWRALAYDSMVKLNKLVLDACSWDYFITDWGKSYYKKLTLNSSAISFRTTQNCEWASKALRWRLRRREKSIAIEAEKKAEKKRKAKEEAKKRVDDYWAEHADDKARLESERKDLQQQIAGLNTTQKEQVAALNKEIAAIPGQADIDNLDERIKKMTDEKASLGIFKGREKKVLQEQIDQAIADKKAVQDRMDAAKKEIEGRISAVKSEIQKKRSPLQRRANSIKTELTKARK